MKILKCFLFVAAVAVAMTSCKKPVEVSFGESTKAIDPQGGTVELALKSNGDWTLEQTAEWMTISPMSGNGDATLTITAEQNATGESRSAEIKATTKDNSSSMTVTQDPLQYYVNITPEEYECGSDGGSLSINVTSNVEWIVTTPQWITSSVTSGSNDAVITLTISPIEGDVADFREGKVIVGSLLASAHMNVIQHVDPILTIEVDPNVLDFVREGESKTVSVTTEDSWAAYCEEDWVSLSQMEGTGDAEITVSVGENPIYTPRNTRVFFVTAGEISTILRVRQEASIDPHFLEVSPTEFSFDKDGGEGEITIGCDVEWSFDYNNEWLSVSPMSGTGNGTAVLTVLPNTIQEPRTVSFFIKSGELVEELTVSQEAGDEPIVATFEPDTIYPSYQGGLQHVDLYSNCTWQLEASSWITLITSSGEGDASFDILVDLNSDPEERVGYVNVKHGGQVVGSLVVVQEGKPNILETNVTEIEARPEGGEYTVQVTANQTWTANCDVDWFVIDPESGSGNGDIVLTVEAMTGPRPRTGHLKIVGSTGAQVIVTVEQHQ